MPDATAVGLHADLNEALATLLAHGLNPQDRRVGVRTNHRDGVAGLGLLVNSLTRAGIIHTVHFFPMAKATRVVVLRVK